MKTNEHRKAIVRALIHGCRSLGEGHESAFVEDRGNHYQGDVCLATSLFFPDKLSENQITVSNYGSLWMGLWLDEPLCLHDGDNTPSRIKGQHGSYHGNTLFPRWLAEVLNHEVELDIKEEDIYDT